MPLYEANGDKQKPIARTGKAFYSHATCPTNEIVLKRPSFINVNSEGEYAFLYETTSSAGGDVSKQIANFVWLVLRCIEAGVRGILKTCLAAFCKLYKLVSCYLHIFPDNYIK